MKLEDIEKYLPKYLSPENQKELYEQLKDFPNNINKIYGSNFTFDIGILQSDIVMEIPFFNLPDISSKNAKVMVVSNSCDIDPKNDRPTLPKVSYVPLISLDKFIQLLTSKGIDTERTMSIVESIKKQEKTNMFYLPKGANIQEDSIVLFENILSIDRDYFYEVALKSESKMATLSNYGFYMFLLKLSIHFTRIQEAVDRN
ncbi:MAG: hypothetical protein GQ570_04425 [Helicobacteraceae bacterium]|nr:hypothetical protein [Helicobacteraceae bacterium]